MFDPKFLALRILKHSNTIANALPEARRLALLETCKCLPTADLVYQIIIENLAGSPYIPHAIKMKISNLVLDKDWDGLSALLLRDEAGNSRIDNNMTAFDEYKHAIVTIFMCSRRMKRVDARRRLQICHELQRVTTKEMILELCLRALHTATTLHNSGKMQVANDMVDNRYDLLLLPDRLDCDEIPRQDECPICLDRCSDKQLLCGHAFCTMCIERWFENCSHGRCPLCNKRTSSSN